jgi:hypothetical protein
MCVIDVLKTMMVTINDLSLNKRNKPMERKFLSALLLAFFILSPCLNIASGNPGIGSKEGAWTVTGKFGSAILLQEFYGFVTFPENEFSHESGLALDLGINRKLDQRWEPGINFSLYRLSGTSDLPEFSANGLHPSFMNLYQWPVEYVTVSTTLSGMMKYHLLDLPGSDISRVRLDPFVEIGAGVIFFFNQLGYSNPPPDISEAVIFEKGTGEKPRSEPGNVMQVSAGFGTEIDLPQNISLVISVNADIVNYDCMDAVHNYTNAERNNARTIVAKIMTGVVIPVGGGPGRRPLNNLWGP